MDTATAWNAYDAAVSAAGVTDLDKRDAIDSAVAALVRAERAAVVDQLYLVAERPDAGPIGADIVRPVTVTR